MNAWQARKVTKRSPGRLPAAPWRWPRPSSARGMCWGLCSFSPTERMDRPDGVAVVLGTRERFCRRRGIQIVEERGNSTDRSDYTSIFFPRKAATVWASLHSVSPAATARSVRKSTSPSTSPYSLLGSLEEFAAQRHGRHNFFETAQKGRICRPGAEKMPPEGAFCLVIGKKGIAILGAVAYNIVIILGILYQLHRAARRNTGPASRYFGLIRGESRRHPAHSRWPPGTP